MKKKEKMVLALAKEIQMRKNEFENEAIETIHFGG
jgi:oxygen-independent coproporphyrinogen-3 oxidase